MIRNNCNPWIRRRLGLRSVVKKARRNIWQDYQIHLIQPATLTDDAVEEAMEKENIALAENIKNLMKNMNLTAEQAMEATGLSEEQKRTIRKLLENND